MATTKLTDGTGSDFPCEATANACAYFQYRAGVAKLVGIAVFACMCSSATADNEKATKGPDVTSERTATLDGTVTTPVPHEVTVKAPLLADVIANESKEGQVTNLGKALAKQQMVVIHNPNQVSPQYVLSVDRIDPPRPVEGATATVYFTVYAVWGSDYSGTVDGTVLTPDGKTVALSLKGQAQKLNVAVKVGTNTAGSISFTAPKSGPGIQLNLSYGHPPEAIMPGRRLDPAGKSPPVATDGITLDIVTILDTDYANPPPTWNPQDPNWTQSVSSGHSYFDSLSTWLTYKPRYEWNPAFSPNNEDDDTIVGLSGWVASWHLSTDDVPFTHPFGLNHFDCNTDIVADAAYQIFAADESSDTDRNDLVGTSRLGLNDKSPLVHVETDLDFIPDSSVNGKGFRPPIPDATITAEHYDRAAVFGRLIVDCGHPNFQTEIHPPLMYVCADVGADGVTTSATVISRPWLVSQEFGDGGLVQHLGNEVIKLIGRPIPTDAWGKAEQALEAIFSGGISAEIPSSAQIEAHVKFKPPFSASQLLHFYVRPPTSRKLPTDRLMVAYYFKARAGVVVYLQKADDDTLHVFVEFDPTTFKPAPYPANPTNWTLSAQQLDLLHPGLGSDIAGASYALHGVMTAGSDFIGSIAAPASLNRGLIASQFSPPNPPNFTGDAATVVAIDNLGNGPHSNIDNSDANVWPVAGWITMHWSQTEEVFFASGKLTAASASIMRVPVNQAMVSEFESRPLVKSTQSVRLLAALKGDTRSTGSVPLQVRRTLKLPSLEMRDGQWEFNLIPEINKGSALPKNSRAVNIRVCLSDGQATTLVQAIPGFTEKNGWHVSNAQSSNNTVTWTAAYSGVFAGNASGKISYNGDTCEGTMEVTATYPNEEPTKLDYTIVGHWIANCTGQ